MTACSSSVMYVPGLHQPCGWTSSLRVSLALQCFRCTWWMYEWHVCWMAMEFTRHKAAGSRQQQQAETPIWSSAFTWFTTLNPIECGWPATEIASAASFSIARNFFNINNIEAINVEKKLAFSQNSIWIIIWQFGLSACNKIFHFFPSSFRGRMRICLPDVSPARACIGFQFTKCLYTCTRTSRISVAFNRTRMQFQMHSNAIPDAFQTRGENLHLIISNREVGAVLL